MAWVGQLEPLEAAVQDAGDGPGTVQWRDGDLVDDGAEVVSGELGGPQPLPQDWTGVFPLVPPGLRFGEPGLDPRVDLRVQRVFDRGGPQQK